MDVFIMDRKLVCVVEFPNQGQKRAHWAVYNLNNDKISWGWSAGVGGEYGSVPMAMKNAKAAARRFLRKELS